MNLKPTLLATGMTLALGAMALAPQAAKAAPDGTVTINGKVLSSTCTVTGTSGTNTVVNLNDVPKSALTTSGNTAGAMPFTIALTGCPTTPSGVNVGLQFYSGQDITGGAAANGQLLNTVASGSGGATNVDIQLLDSTGTTPVFISSALPNGNGHVTDSTVVPAGGALNLAYTAQYYATGAATAGLVTATTQFVINYQ